MAYEYDKKLIRLSNNLSEGRLTNNNYVKFELAKLRHDTKLYDKITMPKRDVNDLRSIGEGFTGYVIYKNSHMFVLESKKSGYNEAFTWWDLLMARKFKGNKEGTNG